MKKTRAVAGGAGLGERVEGGSGPGAVPRGDG